MKTEKQLREILAVGSDRDAINAIGEVVCSLIAKPEPAPAKTLKTDPKK